MFAGIDIGSLSCKVVILDGFVIRSSATVTTGCFPRKAGEAALDEALRIAGIKHGDIRRAVCTGYGRNLLAGIKPVTEITCFARGASFLVPGIEMVIDIGGQDSKVILVDGKGEAGDFFTNDKCAAGTGRFLETMARALGMQVDEMAEKGLDAQAVQISSTCGVFAESEIVGLLAADIPLNRVVAGIHKSIADRTHALTHRLGSRERIMFCGGVSKNQGVRRALEKALGKALIVPDKPQTVGALGAAITAKQG